MVPIAGNWRVDTLVLISHFVLELWRLERRLVDRSKGGPPKDLWGKWVQQLSEEPLNVHQTSYCRRTWTVGHLMAGGGRMSGERMGQLNSGGEGRENGGQASPSQLPPDQAPCQSLLLHITFPPTLKTTKMGSMVIVSLSKQRV